MQTISVQIIAADAKTLSILPLDEQQDCPRCQAGQGCGTMPWFRGLFRDRAPLILAQTTPPLSVGDAAVLSLEADTINRLSFLSYAAPLIAFILTLWLSHNALAEWAQLLLALSAMAAAFLYSRRLANRLLRRQLRLSPAGHRRPTLCKTMN